MNKPICNRFDELLSILQHEIKMLDERIDATIALFDANEIKIAELEMWLGQTIQ